MRIAPLLLALSAALLSSCAGWHGSKHVHPQGGAVEAARANKPKIEVVDDAVIVIDQEPIFIPRNFIDKSITWEIVPPTSPYSIAAVSVDTVKAGLGSQSNGHPLQVSSASQTLLLWQAGGGAVTMWMATGRESCVVPHALSVPVSTTWYVPTAG